MENLCKNYVIAIDGEAGTGKSTLAKNIAKKYGIVYMDTGAMYRCVTLDMLNSGIDISQIDKISTLLDNIKIEMINDNGEDKFLLNDIDVTKEIREKRVNDLVSQVSHVPVVRERMVDLQRKLAQGKKIVMEGRDIGTNVFPNAEVKIYLTASAEERAKRRFLQNKEKGIDIPYEEILANVIFRDNNDKNSDVAPLKKAEDAFELDTTNYTLEEVEEIVMSKVKEKVDINV
ncbi:MAG: (d)CMP kinase [Clostridia bacterium]|nr:(d)CMP kinase [Clostridia bacterium]